MHSSICKTYSGAVVLHRSMLELEEGVGSVTHGYMCILLYAELIRCGGVP